MSAAPHDGDREGPPRPSGKRVRLVVALVVALAFLLVFGYMILVGGLAGD